MTNVQNKGGGGLGQRLLNNIKNKCRIGNEVPPSVWRIPQGWHRQEHGMKIAKQ